MQLNNLRRLLIDEVQELYFSETLLEQSLPRMAQGADAADLKNAFQKHHEQTKAHIERLDQACSLLAVSPRGGHGFAIKAMIREVEDRLGEGGDPHVIDAMLLAAARRVEHWEIATYSTLQLYATALDQDKVAELFSQTLAEELETEKTLANMAAQVHGEAKQPAH
ncbi:ferritin-like domain-containing protein [Acidipila sp. EB88]|uniref:YciE/YciF ferroxidase family protein n=1 Tax=Acidipila sp. EB88 TaxID=2305226 RepID=UPI00131547F1|nr:DUF892 family protein [Acidipila sp. EB88]